MGYETKLETLAAVKVTVPKDHPLYIEGHPIRFGPYPNCLTNREVMVEAYRRLGEEEQKYRIAVERGAAGIGLGKDEHASNAYRQHLIDVLEFFLYDYEEDAESLACPSSRHELEEDHYPTTWSARSAIAFGVTSAEAMENLHPEAKAQVEKVLGTRRIQPAKLEELAEKVRHMRDVQVRYFAATAEDRAAAKMEGKHWMWKPKGSLAPELLKLSKQLEGEVDILLAEISKGGGNA